MGVQWVALSIQNGVGMNRTRWKVEEGEKRRGEKSCRRRRRGKKEIPRASIDPSMNESYEISPEPATRVGWLLSSQKLSFPAAPEVCVLC